MPNSLVDLRTSVSNVLADIESARAGLAAVTAVASDMESRMADSALSPAKALVKVVHDQRMSITRRIDAFKKSVIAQENEIVAAINEEIERVKSLQVRYVTAKAAYADEERRRLADESRANDIEARLTGTDAPSVAVEQKQGPLVSGVHARVLWSFEIVDADAVPRQYCRPDESAIRAYMSAAKANGAEMDDLSVPGVKFFKKVSV